MRRLLIGVALATAGTLASAEGLSRGAQLDRLLGLHDLAEPAISPDAQWVAYLMDDDVWRVAAKGGEPEQLVPNQEHVVGLGWSPNGRWLTYIADDSKGRSQVWGLPARMGSPRQFTTVRAGNVTGYAWSPDSERLVARIAEPAERLTPPGQSSDYTGDPVSLDYKDADLRDVLLKFSEISGLNFVLAPDVTGRVTMRVVDTPWDEVLDNVLGAHGLAYALHETTVRIGRLSTLTLEPSPEPSATPTVINTLQFKREGLGHLTPVRTRVAVIEVPSGLERTLDVGGLEVAEVNWSPDGSTLALAAARPVDPASNLVPDYDIFVMPADGSALPRAVVVAPGDQDVPAFSRDGKGLVYRTEHDHLANPYSESDLAAVSLAGGEARLLGPAIDRSVGPPQLSADGKAVLFLLEDAGCVHVARVDLRTGRLERVLTGERTVTGFSEARDGTLVVLEGDGHRAGEIAIVEHGKARLLVAPNKQLLANVALGEVQRWRVRSYDGTAVDGFIVRPQGAAGSPKRAPAILWLHGGPNVQAKASFEPVWQALALAGYIVIAPNPRGSSGYGTAYASAIKGAWGTHDFDDVMAAVDAAIAAGIIDPLRLGVGGSSYGGWLTNHILTRTTRFRAAVSGAGLSNLFADLGVSDSQRRLEAELGLPWDNRDAWMRQSPWFDAKNVKTPTLVYCGEDDIRTPLSQSELWYYALRRLGVETELVIYPGEGHGAGSRKTAKDRIRRTLAWFDKFILPDSPSQPGSEPGTGAPRHIEGDFEGRFAEAGPRTVRAGQRGAP